MEIIDSHNVAKTLSNDDYFVDHISKFAGELGVKYATATNGKPYDVIFNILETWKGKTGQKANYQKLENALRSLGFISAAGKLSF